MDIIFKREESKLYFGRMKQFNKRTPLNGTKPRTNEREKGGNDRRLNPENYFTL